MLKETANDPEGPKKEEVKLSATPRTMAARRVPPMLPSPPSTVTANIRPMYSRPMVGSTGPMMMSREPAMAAVALRR